jgi:hypothetical protein
MENDSKSIRMRETVFEYIEVDYYRQFYTVIWISEVWMNLNNRKSLNRAGLDHIVYDYENYDSFCPNNASSVRFEQFIFFIALFK